MTTVPIISPPGGGVLVASPSTSLREQVLQSFQRRHCPVQEASGGADALVKLESGDWQVLYLDRRLPDLDAEELVSIIKRRFPGIQVVVVDSDGPQGGNGFGSAAEELQPPPEGTESLASRVVTPVTRNQPLPGMVGESESMLRVYGLARLVAPRTTSVLILGASGTGKELVARAIHELSPRTAEAIHRH